MSSIIVSPEVRITDSENDIKLYHYIQCSESSSETLKNTRGVVMNGNEEILCKTFNFTPEYFSDEPDRIKQVLEPIFDKCSFYKAEEGTLLRVWFYEDKWHISSHKKLNAFNSRWGSSYSHGEMFRDAVKWQMDNGTLTHLNYETDNDVLDTFFNTLNTGKKI